MRVHLAGRQRCGAALLVGWGFGLGQFVVGLNWIATAFTYQAAMPAWLGWVAVVLLSLYLAIYPALAAGLAWRFGRDDRVVTGAVLGGAWAITEWLRGTMFTGFPWNPGRGRACPDPLIAITALIGTYGLSGLVVLARRRDLARILPQVAAAGGDLGATRSAVGAACVAVPGDPLAVAERAHRPAEHRPGGQVARRASTSEAARRLAPCPARPSDAAAALLWPEAR